jgi:phospholipid/cholesterol/gamma-HCH transport system substrate-binding protein
MRGGVDEGARTDEERLVAGGRGVTVTRGAALAALALVVVLVAWLLLEGNGGHEYELVFQNAGQLVKDDNVEVGGRRIGSVRAIELTNNNLARVKIEVEEPYAPLHEGTKAVIRLTSLSGIANRYVALTLGPDSSQKLPDGATLGTDSTTSVVDLDQVFNALDPRTRKSLQGVIQGFATQYAGKGREANQAAEYFNPALSTSRRLVGQLTTDEAALTRFIVSTADAMTAISERREDLSSLIGNANATASAIASENVALGRALGLLPTTLRRANTTFVNLRATLDDLDVLVDESKPATKDLAPFLRALRPLVHDARPTIADLSALISSPGADNDLIDTNRLLPRLQRVASPAFTSGRQAMQKLQPVLEFARPYTPDLVGWFRDFGQGAANYDANGHFARVQPIFSAFQFTDNPAGGVLTPIPPEKRYDALQTGALQRCPGAASQPAVDGSSPYPGGSDCRPGQVPPGP